MQHLLRCSPFLWGRGGKRTTPTAAGRQRATFKRVGSCFSLRLSYTYAWLGGYARAALATQEVVAAYAASTNVVGALPLVVAIKIINAAADADQQRRSCCAAVQGTAPSTCALLG